MYPTACISKNILKINFVKDCLLLHFIAYLKKIKDVSLAKSYFECICFGLYFFKENGFTKVFMKPTLCIAIHN